MLRKGLVRCDTRPQSGLGHLKRCLVVASKLSDIGIESIFLVDREVDPLPDSRFNYFVSESLSDANPLFNAQEVCRVASKNNCDFVFGDSYEITPEWIERVRAQGFFVGVFDDLNTLANADCRINFSPQASPYGVGGLELTGPAFFPYRGPGRIAKGPKPRSVIFHAGGTGDFSLRALVYRTLSSRARRSSLSVTWLIANQRSRQFLIESGLFSDGDLEREWSNAHPMVWREFDLVVGPASTSLYEAIIQGVLPLSFVISDSQSDSREQWLAIGHSLHLTSADCTDVKAIERFFDLALHQFSVLLSHLHRLSYLLDGKGGERISAALGNNASPLKPMAPKASKCTAEVRACDVPDSLRFLQARNAQGVRSVSTNAREISWVHHINWWLKTEIERFVFVRQDLEEGYFWHRACVVSQRKYLIGGWFPATARPSFDVAIQMLDWQLAYCSQRYPDHVWVATIQRANQAVIALNRRFGFSEASEESMRDVNSLLPGTTSDYVVLERASIL